MKRGPRADVRLPARERALERQPPCVQQKGGKKYKRTNKKACTSVPVRAGQFMFEGRRQRRTERRWVRMKGKLSSEKNTAEESAYF